MTLQEFRNQPFIQHFFLYDYYVNGIFDKTTLNAYIYRNTDKAVINNINIADFISSDLNEFSSTDIVDLLHTVLSFDEADIDPVGRCVIIKNIDNYMDTNTINDFEIRELDLANKTLSLIVSYPE